ncbi:MAG: glycosyltransferase, partial [Caldilineaceae bacterium]
ESRAEYEVLLSQAALVVSTADHEFFGISLLEAVLAGAFPLLPKRLSYPELLPPALHDAILYRTQEELFVRALAFLQQPERAANLQATLSAHIRATYTWPIVAAQMDGVVERMLRESRVDSGQRRLIGPT